MKTKKISIWHFEDLYQDFGYFNEKHQAREIRCDGCESPILESEEIWVRSEGKEPVSGIYHSCEGCLAN